MNDTNQLALGSVLADEAIQRTASHNEAFVDAAIDTIAAILTWQDTLTSDDVWKYVVMVRQPADNRAIGAAFRKIHEAGIIKPDGYEQSKRASRHGAPIMRWRRVGT